MRTDYNKRRTSGKLKKTGSTYTFHPFSDIPQRRCSESLRSGADGRSSESAPCRRFDPFLPLAAEDRAQDAAQDLAAEAAADRAGSALGHGLDQGVPGPTG